MATTADTIDHNTLMHLVEAGAVRGADVIGQAGGWGVVIKYGSTERALAARRGTVRNFKKFETLVGYLKDMGIAEYRVNAANFDPVGPKPSQPRPDASQRMKRAHEAAAYDASYQAKVGKALADFKDGTNPIIPEEEWQAQRAEWEREARGA